MKELKEEEATIREIAGDRVEVTKVEPLGSSIAIYVRNPKAIYETNFVREVAGALKRRVLVRTDEQFLKSPEEAKRIIEEIVPKEAGIERIYFKQPFGEVVIVARKPGLVIGKSGERLREIMVRSTWSPVVERAPSRPSQTLESMRKSDVEYASEKKKFLLKLGKRLARKPTTALQWARVMMLGGFREVGRSCMLLQTNKSNILIDCGVNPASTKPEEAFPFIGRAGVALDDIDAIILTHAHTDHMTFIPFLYRYGYEGPVYLTPPTRPIMALMQNDYLTVMKKYYGQEPPFSKKDIHKELIHTITVDYGRVINVTDDVKFTFYNAGHILGSSIVHIHIGEGKHNLIYSGDIKYGYTHLFDPAHTAFPRVETLFVESTYGRRDAVNPSRREAEEKLINIILKTVKEKKGSVLIPAFAVGRSQEVLLAIEHYARNNEWDIPIWIDGMILEALAIHMAYPEYLKRGLERRILSNDNPFEFEYIRVAKGKSKEEIVDGEPSVIIAPSGMLTGGPSVEYLKLMAPEKRHSIVFVGYQAPGTLGSKIQQGMKEVPVFEEGEMKMLKINMDVYTAEGFSGHSDRRELMAWLSHLSNRPSRVYTMHGDGRATIELARDIKRKLRVESYAPWNLEAIRLF